MRETVGYQLDLYERAEFRADLFREESDSLVQNFAGQVKIGNLLKDKTSGFGLVVPFSYRKRPVASPDYPSYPNDLRLGLGFRLALSDGYAYMLRAQMSLDSIYRDDYGSLNSYENSIGARLVTEGATISSRVTTTTSRRVHSRSASVVMNGARNAALLSCSGLDSVSKDQRNEKL